MAKTPLQTDSAPRPAGPYSQGIRAENLVFVSGQVGLDPKTGQPVSGDVQEQTRQVLRNIQAVLQAAGCDLSDVVKTTCFLSDIGDFAPFNQAYREFFPNDPPARSTIQAGLVSPWVVEIEAVALRP
ncbi:MAG TPA: Rid family detoxifying hydrolase [Chloroflexota bacterium]|nr:Rid family detoxifying hydrolase [Chloroflexota bacterium]